jgi:hypothetical protein
MEPAIVFTAVAAIAVTVYLISSIMIYADLKKRNIKVSFIFLRFMIPLYANEYKKITLAETGKIGSLFYYWIISINSALLFVVAAIIFSYT